MELKKGTGCFSFRSADGHADATYCRVQTSTPSPLAGPPFRTVCGGSDSHEQRNRHVLRARIRLFDSSSGFAWITRLKHVAMTVFGKEISLTRQAAGNRPTEIERFEPVSDVLRLNRELFIGPLFLPLGVCAAEKLTEKFSHLRY